MQVKTCTKCGELKRNTDFAKRLGSLQVWCRACMKKANNGVFYRNNIVNLQKKH